MAIKDKSISADQLVGWPYDGDTTAPIDWFAHESPPPLPADLYGKRTGYPITLQSYCSCIFSDLDIQLSSPVSSSGSEIDFFTKNDGYLNYGADGNLKSYYTDTVIFVPGRPLLPNHRYKVVVTGNMADYFKRDEKRPFRKEWSFTTFGGEPLKINLSPDKTELAPGETIDVTVTGGTGNYLNQGGYRFQFASWCGGNSFFSSLGENQGDAFKFVEVSPTHFRITRGVNATQKCGNLNFTAYDSSDAKVKQTITVP